MGGSTSQTQSSSPWAPVRAPLTNLIGDAGALYESGGFEINPYQGDMVADMNATTLGGINGLTGAATGAAGAIQGAQDIVSGIAGTDMSAIRQGVLADIMPAINSSFAGSGMTGSSLHQQNLAQSLTNGMTDAQLAIQGQQLQAAGMIPGMAQSGMQPYQTIINAGNMLQGQEQNEIDALVQQDLMGQGAQASALQQYAALLSGIGGQFGSSTATQSSSPGLGGILGGALQVGSLFSDERLKTDVKQVGTLFDGTPVYTYRYLDAVAPEGLRGKVTMGVMAQEAPAHAVASDPSGFMRVNYGAL